MTDHVDDRRVIVLQHFRDAGEGGLRIGLQRCAVHVEGHIAGNADLEGIVRQALNAQLVAGALGSQLLFEFSRLAVHVVPHRAPGDGAHRSADHGALGVLARHLADGRAADGAE